VPELASLEELRRKALDAIARYMRAKLAKSEFHLGKDLVHYAGAVYDEREVVAMVDSILDGWFALSKRGEFFERRLAEYIGTRHAVLVNSGSSANLLAVGSLVESKMVKSMDEVITPALTFPATINPLILYGLKPVLVDVSLETLNLDVSNLKAALSGRTKLIMLPHLFGIPNHMNDVMSFAEQNGLLVVEDCCDALGTEYNGTRVGSIGIMGTFSFYVAHQITLGEGGAITTNDERLAYVIKSMREWGRVPSGEPLLDLQSRDKLTPDYSLKYTFVTKGYNVKPLEFQAAFGLEQLNRLPEINRARRRNYKVLSDLFQEYSRYFMLPKIPRGSSPSWYSFPLMVRPTAPFKRWEIVEYLEKNNIETRPLFTGNITRQPAYRGIDFKRVGALENSDLATESGFFIGVYPGIDGERMDYMISVIRRFLASYP